MSKLSGAGPGRLRDPRSSESWRSEENFVSLSGKQRTILLIFPQPNFMKFEHNTSIGVAMNLFGTEF